MTRRTPSQSAAIAARGNLLLEAGAGTGKTSTLVARCVEQVLDMQEPLSLDQLLMVTFTEAAAAEMRHRIRVELNRRIADDPGNLRLAEQIALLDQAHIGTLHGFCFRLIRDHFQELGLDPQLRVLDDSEARLLANETLRDLLDAHYENDSEISSRVRGLIRFHGGGRDEPVATLVLQIHRFLQTLPSPAGWLEAQRVFWAGSPDSVWETELTNVLLAAREEWLELLAAQPAENLAAGRCIELLQPLGVATPRSIWSRALQEIASFEGDEHWTVRGSKKQFRDPIRSVFQEAKFYESFASVTEENGDPLVQDFQRVQPHMLALLDLLTEFAAEFAERKRQQTGVDFSDLEQFSLRLLWTDSGEPSAVAEQWRSRLRQVFVDEYQDINEAQDRIIAALSRDIPHGNRFLVGDVKQSIYGFRLARPDIFLHYAKTWGLHADQGQVLPLSDNFRSHEAILDFINHCFQSLLREDVGGIDYPESAFLRFGDPDGRAALRRSPENGPRVELIHRLTTRKKSRDPDGELFPEGDEAEQSNAEKEATLAANRLKEMRADGMEIFDRQTGALRPVDWRDMAVLLRATSSKAEIYSRIFARAGIPLVAARRGFFDAIEITDLVSLLMLLDNPLQDIPLLAVLRSPMVGLTPDQLVTLRIAARREPAFWSALMRYVETANRSANPGDPALLQRLNWFLPQFQKWRDQARRVSLSQTLEDILEATRYLSWLGAQSRGTEAAANVHRLLELTRHYDAWQGHGLNRFLNYVRLVQAEGDGPEPASAQHVNAVRLMTIHASKGLEFPVVVLADLAKAFRKDQPVAGITVDETLGLCPLVYTEDGRRAYPSLLLHACEQQDRARDVAEELRLLYVAMTRACDRLVLLGTTPQKRPEKWLPPGSPKVPRSQLVSSGSLFDFLGPLLPGLTGRLNWFEQAGGSGGLLSWRMVQPDEAIELNTAIDPVAATPVSAPAPDIKSLRARIEFRYPFLEATRRTGKTTVTRLRKQFAALDDEESGGLFEDTEARKSKQRPGARKPAGPDAAAVGIAYHAFFQHVRLDQTDDLTRLEDERDRMIRQELLTAEEAAALRLENVHSFWNGDVGRAFLDNRAGLRRELPFTASFTQRELDAFAGKAAPGSLIDDDQVIVQGVADLAMIRENEIWILDFKSDRITADQLTARVADYRPQVQLYQQALQRTCRRPVSRLWLHFLHLNRSVEVNLS